MSEVLYDSKFLQFKKTKSPSGGDWFYCHRPNAKDVVAIAPILHEKDCDYLIFLETQRPPIYAENVANICIEFPAGLVGDEIKNETIDDAIEKELLEETGYQADKVKIVCPKVTTSGGLTSETITYAIADIYDITQKQTPVTDGGIILNLHKIKLNDVYTWLKEQIKDGKVISSPVYGLLYFVCN